MVWFRQVDSHGMISMTPDFNSDRPAYRIENRHRGKAIVMHSLPNVGAANIQSFVTLFPMSIAMCSYTLFQLAIVHT